MHILGISAGFHDAAVCVLDNNGNIQFAAHSERYSKIKNDHNIDSGLIDELKVYDISQIGYYENPLKKQLRQVYAGQTIEWTALTKKQIIKKYFNNAFPRCDIKTFNHHLSHAAAGFQTSNFDRATVVVIDAIGEWETISIYAAEYRNNRAVYKKLWTKYYPHSIGLFYSSMTKAVGLKPLDEEYILMGMSAYGDRDYSNLLKHHFIKDEWNLEFTDNLHLGTDLSHTNYLDPMDVAAGAQTLTENLICNVMKRAKSYNWSDNLVYMGGVALNCLANSKLFEYFQNIWIMPNPGDAGSSLGAAALLYGKRLNWTNCYLGHEIPGPYPVNSLLDELLKNKIVGIANGRAEFGPRALGNRSLLADPRGTDIKDKVNEIKQRQKFRPFAPVILEELANDYFEMPTTQSRYMQFIAPCRYPDKFPAIAHYDNTSRVQTVPKDNSGIRELLEKWFILTGCPMLLNTSLNIRGQPIVNNRKDADDFQTLYNVRVFS